MKTSKSVRMHAGSKFIRAKKSLGQNFLRSKSILSKIVTAGNIEKVDTVLEIGPGHGALTEKLLEKAGCVVAVEKDDALFELLKEKFRDEIKSGSLVLVHDDILEFDPGTYSIIPGAYKIIANIPYNITGAILKKFLSSDIEPQMMVLMVQLEVAKRIMARDGKESLLSISVKSYGKPEMVCKVGKEYFSPKPKVDSAVIKISNISHNLFDKGKVSENTFWNVVKAGFAHKRKKLTGNLKGVDSINQEHLAKIGHKRAEELSLDEWFYLISNQENR